MREAVPDWEIPEHKWTLLEAEMNIPDPNDRHVLAAAVAGDVDYIVTSNLQDFPPDILAEYGLEAVDPDAFIVSLCAADWTTAITAFAKMRARRRKPQATASDFADALATGGLPMTANRLRSALDSV